MKGRILFVTTMVSWMLFLVTCQTGAGAGDYQALVRLDEEIYTFRRPGVEEGLPDYSPAAIEAQKRDLESFFNRLEAIEPEGWPVPQKVDFLLVRAELNDLDFKHRVLRPWFRDPGLYVDVVQRLTFQEFPLPEEKLSELEIRLGAVPAFLAQAEKNLNEGAGELVQLALRNLDQPDGVGHGHPYRAVPPMGTVGWYEDFVQQLEKHHADLAPVAKAAQESVIGFRDWLEQNQGKLNEPAGIGKDDYNWYLKNVLYMPFTTEDIITIGDRELHRGWTFLKLEHNKNRDAPILEPASSAEDYEERIRQADEQIRRFIEEKGILTIPEFVGEFGHNVPWIERSDGKRNFWEEIQFRDPRPDHVHAVIPGHRFDALVKRHDERPIRGKNSDYGRTEGWALYLEEMFLQAGLLDDLPRTRELFYIFQIARAVRNRAEVHMHTNEFTVQDAVRYMVDRTPFMDENVARVDAEIYLRRPAYGISYQMGKIQMDQLVADRAMQLGDAFDLKEFHDQFLAAGIVPISLIRWEMTGLTDEVQEFWGPNPELGAGRD